MDAGDALSDAYVTVSSCFPFAGTTTEPPGTLKAPTELVKDIVASSSPVFSITTVFFAVPPVFTSPRSIPFEGTRTFGIGMWTRAAWNGTSFGSTV